jgi:hypothetical protein
MQQKMSYEQNYFNDDISFNDGLVEGRDFYMENGYRVMTADFLTRRGFCCANGCRHCPYWPRAQKGNTHLRDK